MLRGEAYAEIVKRIIRCDDLLDFFGMFVIKREDLSQLLELNRANEDCFAHPSQQFGMLFVEAELFRQG